MIKKNERFNFGSEPWVDCPQGQARHFGFFNTERDFVAAVDFALRHAERVGRAFEPSEAFLTEMRELQNSAARAALKDFFYKRALADLEQHANAVEFKNAWEAFCKKQGKKTELAPNPWFTL